MCSSEKCHVRSLFMRATGQKITKTQLRRNKLLKYQFDSSSGADAFFD